MKLFSVLILLSLFVSCAIVQPQAQSKKTVSWTPNKDFWMGKSEEVLALHPIFATMPVETRTTPNGIETRRFTEGGAITSHGQCTGKDCAGVSDKYACNHVFYIQKGKINNYFRVGSYCGEERIEMRPLDANGVAEYSESEKQQVREISSIKSEEKTCKSTSECTDGMSCSGGYCKSLGLWGKIFNP